MISYDYPLNERIRTLLRLEGLFDRVRGLMTQNGEHEHHAALMTLFEIVEVTSRADLKSDLIQELERHRVVLEALRGNPAIDADGLETVLAQIREITGRLQTLPGKMGQHVRENEWLMSIRQRTAIPGGLCAFDLPSYHFWLRQQSSARSQDLNNWLEPLSIINEGIRLVLKLLRESGNRQQHLARGGAWQQMLSGKTGQLLRVFLPEDKGCIPEISANRYAINIRFTAPGSVTRPKQLECDIEFELALCSM